MSEDLTEPYEPQGQGDSSYDWDYDEEPKAGPNILWGRVAVLGLAVILAFFVGRLTAGGGEDPEQVASLRTELSDTRAELNQARAELAEATADATPTPTTESTPAEGEGEGDGSAAQTYEVQPGDTLRGIAERFYQDATFDDCIQEANGISDPLSITPGQELEIPEESSC